MEYDNTYRCQNSVIHPRNVKSFIKYKFKNSNLASYNSMWFRDVVGGQKRRFVIIIYIILKMCINNFLEEAENTFVLNFEYKVEINIHVLMF